MTSISSLPSTGSILLPASSPSRPGSHSGSDPISHPSSHPSSLRGAPRAQLTAPTRRTLLGAGVAVGTGLACRTPLASVADAPATRSPRASDAAASLDELYADLEDQSGAHEPISNAERALRRARLAELMGERGIDAFLVEPGATLVYLTGLDWWRSERLFGCVFLANGDPFWVLPAFEEDSVSQKLAEVEAPGSLVTWHEHEYAYGPLGSELARRGVERLALDPSARAFVPYELEAHLPQRPLYGRELVEALRGRKDAHELALLRAANELTQQAIEAVAARMRPGMTDAELGRHMKHAQERLGLKNPWVLPLYGPNAALPHGSPEGDVLARGAGVLVDTGGALHGYQSDRTRSWIFDGAPSAHYERTWNVVRDAQRAAFETLAPGRPCGDVDRAARQVFAAAGFGEGYENFSHRLGHGIGLEVHEGPYLDGGSTTLLAPGMTFSDEPGIYLLNDLGIRLEDIVCVTEDGGDHFGDWQASPLSPAS